MCVYDPMTGGRTFLPLPPDVGRDDHLYTTCTYVLLTAADGIGIGCSFLLLAADLAGLHQARSCARCIRVQTVSSDAGGEWSPVTVARAPRLPRCLASTGDHYDVAVVLGGVVHWLLHDYVLTYDVSTATVGRMRM